MPIPRLRFWPTFAVYVLLTALALLAPGSAELHILLFALLSLSAALLWRFYQNQERIEHQSMLDKFHGMFQAAPDIVVLTRLADGVIVDVNPRAEALTGFTRAEMLGRTGVELKLWKYPEERARFAEELKAKGFIAEFIAQMQDRQGESHTMSLSSSVMTLKGTAHMLTFFRDISGAQKIEKELRESAQRFAVLFETAPEPVALVSAPEGVFVACNAATEKLLDRPRTDIIGRTTVELAIWPDVASRNAYLEQLNAHSHVDNFETTVTSALGVVHSCAINSAFVALDGKPHILSYLRDITAFKAHEHQLLASNNRLEELVRERTEALEDMNREMESFVYSVSHDLRAPIRAITGFGLSLQDEQGALIDEVGRDYLRRIIDAGTRMNAIVETLLRLSRLSRSELVRSDIDLSRIAHEVTDALWHSHPGRDVEVTIEPGLKAHADASMVRNVLENLLNNAWKYSAKTEHAKIHFGMRAYEGEQAFYVQDNGAGFDMSYAHRLFLPFHRLHHERDFAGTGVGLATVQRIIRAHGGLIWAVGSPGKGATFFFTLPPPGAAPSPLPKNL